LTLLEEVKEFKTKLPSELLQIAPKKVHPAKDTQEIKIN